MPRAPSQDSSAAPRVTEGHATHRRAWALLAGLVGAKLAVVLLRVHDGGGATLRSPLAPLALLYQDAVVVALFALADRLAARFTQRRRAANIGAWVLAFVLVGYSAFNVAVARVFSTPLTRSMLGAAGGALSDSILAYVTPSNVTAIVSVVVASVLVARLRLPAVSARIWLGVLLGALLVGPPAAARIETLGLHRNATVALLATWFPRLAPASKRSPLPSEGRALELTHLAGAARGRNVVWVILESHGAQYLGLYGASVDPTPNLSRLADGSVIFEHAYTAYPESIKGLLTMLCSVHIAPHASAEDYVVQKLPCVSVAETLRAHGYRTGFFHSGRFRYLGMQGIVDGRGFDELHDAESVGGRFVSSFGTDDASTARRLLGFVDQLPSGQRFFAVYSPISGHHPYKSPGEGPRPFPARAELDHYLNDLFAGDAATGELVDGLKRRGLYDKTLFVVVGDHGEAFNQHEGNFAHTLFLYEENVRVPFVVAAPGLTLGRVRAPQLASLTDMAPTTLALLGLPSAKDYEGRSLLEAEPGVAHFQTDHGPLKLGLRHGRFKVLHETEHDRTRLFDLAADPREQRDVAGTEPERAARYRDYLLGWAAGQRTALERQRK